MSNSFGVAGSLAIGSTDVDTSGPTISLAPADSADVSTPGKAKLRFNLTSLLLEMSINAGPWTAFSSTVTGAPSGAKFIIQQPNSSLPNAQSLSALSTGLLKNTTTTGVLTTAVANVDYVSPIFIVTNLTALAAIDISTLQTPNLRWVATLRSWFYLDKTSTLVSDGIEVVTALGGTGRWIRMLIPEPFWLSKLFWSIDPVSGNDENLGYGTSLTASDLVPLKTAKELNRRLLGSNYDAFPYIHVMNDGLDATILTNIKSKNDQGAPTLVGTKTLLGTFTITSYATADPTNRLGYRVTATNLGDLSNVIGSMIQKADGSKTAFAVRRDSANQVRISEPNTSDPISGLVGVATDFVVGDTVKIYSLTKIPCYPFPSSNVSIPSLAWVQIENPTDSGLFGIHYLGTTNPEIIQCILDGGVFNGGIDAIFSCVLLKNTVQFQKNASQTNYIASLNGHLILTTNTVWINDNNTLDFQNYSVQLRAHSGILMSSGGPALAVFDSVDIGHALSVIRCDTNSYWLQESGSIYGDGNTVYLYYGKEQSNSNMKAIINFTTTKTHPIFLVGNEYDISTLQASAEGIVDLSFLSSITNT